MPPPPPLCDQVLPLAGHRVGVTADRRSEEQTELLTRLGARVVHGPVIRTLPLGDDTPLRAATDGLLAAPPTIVIANTGIGVRGWFAAAEAWGLETDLLAALSGAAVHARGPKAFAACLQLGVAVDRREPTERLDALVRHLTSTRLDGERVALQLYGDDVPWAIDELEAAGADVVPVPIYRWVPPDDDGPARRLVHEVLDGQLSAVTFTSPAAVEQLCAIAADDGQREPLLDAFACGVSAACVGPVTAETARRLGVTVACAPDVGRLGLLVRALASTLHARHTHVATDGGEVVVHGAAVRTSTAGVELADRERDVLGLLARRPGAVVARQSFATEVWAGDDGAAALEGTITRLRRKVEPLGLRIVARPRRGYQLAATPHPCPHPSPTS